MFIVAGLAFKMAAVPFHMWTPDVYEGAPSPVTAFMAAAPKVAAIGLTLRVLLGPFGDWAAQWQQVVVVLAIASMVLGAFAAIGQTNIKRLMAYRGIANIGFALVGVAAGTTGRRQRGAGLHGDLPGHDARHLRLHPADAPRTGRYVESIADLAGLSRDRPMLALALAIFMFSLAGIPPLAGFFGKLYVFLAAIDAGLVWFAVVGVRRYRGRRLLLSADRQGDVLRRAGGGVRPGALAGGERRRRRSAPSCSCSSWCRSCPRPLLTSATAAAAALAR